MNFPGGRGESGGLSAGVVLSKSTAAVTPRAKDGWRPRGGPAEDGFEEACSQGGNPPLDPGSRFRSQDRGPSGTSRPNGLTGAQQEKTIFRRVSQLAVAGLVILGASLATAAAPANAATTRTADSRPPAQHAVGGMTITRSPARGSAASPRDFFGFCITAWTGRYVTTSCNGIGDWRQYAYCSASGFTYTSPLLPDPPVDFWIGACPAGQSVISAGVQF